MVIPFPPYSLILIFFIPNGKQDANIVMTVDHAALIAEMPHIEQMPTQERLSLARERRTKQLQSYHRRERDYGKKPKGSRSAAKRNVNFRDSVVLLEAAARNDIDEVRNLLYRGVDPDSCNEDGLTALHQCCIDDNEAMLLLLLEQGANVNAVDSEKWTPLHAAATCGHLKLVSILIARGANLLAVNADGNMPYDICEDETTLDYIEGEMAKRGVTQKLIDETRAHTEMQMLIDLQKLAAKGEDLESCDKQGATPLHVAAANGYITVVEYLLDQNVRTDVKDKDDWQPAHAAACWGHGLDAANNQGNATTTVSNGKPYNIDQKNLPANDVAGTKSSENRRPPEGKDNNDNNGDLLGGGTGGDIVEFTINGNGTLADLKKQRMQIRNNSSADVSSLNSPTSTVTETADSVGSPPSSADLLKLAGDTDDVVGYTRSPFGCCSIQ
ncbi:hypothetical protein Trydic_g181 [Trypoxylus dichotomus]